MIRISTDWHSRVGSAEIVKVKRFIVNFNEEREFAMKVVVAYMYMKCSKHKRGTRKRCDDTCIFFTANFSTHFI